MTDMELLRYAGVLGHTVIVVKDTTDGRSATFHTCDLASARQYVTDEAAGKNAKIYKRTAKGWKAAR